VDIIGLLPSFGGFVFTVIAFVVALSVIVAIHEYGHYIVGRWCGIHAEVFSLGFGPVLWSRHDKDGTRWQIAALPFGGYVKFVGDSGAASGKDGETMEAMSDEERRHTMHGAPLWARSATVAAGPVFNFILSFLIFASVFAYQGVAIEPLTIGQLRAHPAQTETLKVDDQILSIAGIETPPLEEFDTLVEELPNEPELEYEVLRDGERVTVIAPYPYPPAVVTLQPQSAAMDAGLEVGDVILSVGSARIATFEELKEIVGASDGQPLVLNIWREGDVFDLTLTPRRRDLPLADGGFETRWLIGITGGLLFEPQTERVGVFTALGGGVTQTYAIVRSSLSGLYHMAIGAISSCNISGPIGIAQASGAMASQGLQSFIWFVAVLSTAIGMLNLFPIPVLDGGHLVFYAYEAVTGKPPNEKALRILMAIGLSLLLTLMVFAISNDVFCQ